MAKPITLAAPTAAICHADEMNATVSHRSLLARSLTRLNKMLLRCLFSIDICARRARYAAPFFSSGCRLLHYHG
jgi:hypothetical protein